MSSSLSTASVSCCCCSYSLPILLQLNNRSEHMQLSRGLLLSRGTQSFMVTTERYKNENPTNRHKSLINDYITSTRVQIGYLECSRRKAMPNALAARVSRKEQPTTMMLAAVAIRSTDQRDKTSSSCPGRPSFFSASSGVKSAAHQTPTVQREAYPHPYRQDTARQR